MRRMCLAGVIALGVLCAWATAAGAQPPGPRADVPVAQAPPEGDGLPPTTPEQRQRASMAMLSIVVAALLLIYVMLRAVAKARAAVQSPADPTQDLLAQAQKALEERDRREREGDGGERRAP